MVDPHEALHEALRQKYELQEVLGEGGMGTVYLARDIKHDRPVAIKTIHPDRTTQEVRRRFEREISITARLNHPHILSLLDSGVAGETLYYVMPFVEGEALRQRLDGEDRLPLEETLQIAREVASALGYAHGRGVVHRDIKPGNIMLLSGHAVVTDFGIARAIAEAEGVQLTQVGLAIGSPVYMSPEQSTGERAVDGRSDIYSLGCVLYEMLAGEPPFAGSTPLELIARSIREKAPPLGSKAEGVPLEVEGAVHKALAKAPEDRFETAEAFAQALTGGREGAAAAQSLTAVLSGHQAGAHSFWLDLRRRKKLVQWAIAYVVGAWLLLELFGFVAENFGWPGGVVRGATILLGVGFFVTLVLAWYHGEKGHQRVQRNEAIALGILLLVGGGGAFRVATSEDRGFTVVDPTEVVVNLGEGSVAVLPFQNEIGEPEWSWLGRGVSELLATDLAQLEALRVVSSQRLFDLLRQLGLEGEGSVPQRVQARVTQLSGARFMLTGRILGVPGDLVLMATLSDARTGEIAASGRARGSDIFALVDSISARMSGQILDAPVELTPVAQLTTGNFEAFREYRLGRQAKLRFLWGDAAEHFQRAVEIDSTFTLAHFHLSRVLYRTGDLPAAARHLQAAVDNLRSASERDRLFIEGFFAYITGDPAIGERKLRELIRKYPDHKDARIVFSSFLAQWGGTEGEEEATRLLEETLRLDPLYAPAYGLLAYRYARRGDLEGADSMVARYIELEPGEPNPVDSQGEIYEIAGRYEDARTAYRKALGIRPDFTTALDHLVRTYLRENRPVDARRELESYLGASDPALRARALLLKGDTYFWEGDLDAGLRAYDSLVALTARGAEPDLHVQSLDNRVLALIALERYAEADEAADALLKMRGPETAWSAARLHRLGSNGRFDEMEAVKAKVASSYEETPSLQVFARFAALSTDILIAYYRGQHAHVVELSRQIQETGSRSGQVGSPEIRSLLAEGHGEEVLRALPSLGPGSFSEANRLVPLAHRYRQYFEARAHELTGDTVQAIRLYDALVEQWGAALSGVPAFRDVEERRRKLSGEADAATDSS